MKRLLLCSLLALSFHGAALAEAPLATAAPATTIASDGNYLARVPYQTYFADYVAVRKGRPADLVFIGDSITEQWRWGAGAPVWNKHFEQRAVDFGLGADKTQHVLWRLENMDFPGLAPKAAVVMIGTNNVSDSAEDIAAGVKAVVAGTRKRFAGVKIILVSILPNARAPEKMAQVNTLLAPMADQQNLFYLDLASKFTPQGDNWKGLSRDKLHLTTEGYETWAAELQALLPVVLKPTGQ
jgi:lysophospholipase L1-like esterase